MHHHLFVDVLLEHLRLLRRTLITLDEHATGMHSEHAFGNTPRPRNQLTDQLELLIHRRVLSCNTQDSRRPQYIHQSLNAESM